MSRFQKIFTLVLSLTLVALSGPTALAAPARQEAGCKGSDYTVQANDWLSKLAEKAYGDVLAFPQIVEATNAAAAADSSYASIDNADLIEVGWKICIPDSEGMMMAGEGETMMSGEGETMMSGEPTSFTVRIENISDGLIHQGSGVFNTPTDADAPGPLLPGSAYEATFYAEPGDQLSFASMFVQSNDWFIAPVGSGISLFDADGNPINGDITDQVLLWDSGTEADEAPGEGANQAPRQAGPDSGDADPDNTVRQVGDAFAVPAVSELAAVTLESMGDNAFTLRLENISDSSSLATPFAPGVWVVHTADNPLFVTGQADLGLGLEALAEDGNPGGLAAALAGISGRATPLAPGVWAVHSSADPLFSDGQADRGQGLEALAEDGNPADLAAALSTVNGVTSSGVFNTPAGGDGPGPLLPGSAYEFSFEAEDGALSFATMYVQSNDLFFAPSGAGIPLFNADGTPVSGDITAEVRLWDAGTEVNQAPNFGPDQAPRQDGPDSGADEGGPVQTVDDGNSYASVSSLIRVTITTQ